VIFYEEYHPFGTTWASRLDALVGSGVIRVRWS
jgi:hypothetical protein